MTALPTRCRNTNDALRRPFSVTGWRVRRALAERSWVFGAPRRPCLSPRLMRQVREAERPVVRPAALSAPRPAAVLGRAPESAYRRRVEPRRQAAPPTARRAWASLSAACARLPPAAPRPAVPAGPAVLAAAGRAAACSG